MKSLEKFINSDKYPTFTEFRKFVLNRYKDRFDKNPEIKALVADVDFEGYDLHDLRDAYEEAIDFLHESEIYNQFLEELDSISMHDYFVIVKL